MANLGRRDLCLRWTLVLAVLAGTLSPICANGRDDAAAAMGVSGLVVDQAGGPISGARIVLARQPAPPPVAERPQTVTDVQGRWHLDKVPSGRYELRVFARGYVASYLLVERREEGLVSQRGRVGQVVLETGCDLAGMVLDRSGWPVHDARIKATVGAAWNAAGANGGHSTPPIRATSSTDGRFLLRDLPTSRDVSFLVRRAGFADLVEVRRPCAEGLSQPVRLVLDRPSELKVRVLDGGGWPLPDARVTVWMDLPGQSRHAAARSGPDGEVLLQDVWTGNHRLTVGYGDLPELVRDLLIREAQPEAKSLTITLPIGPIGTLSGQVIGRDGAPIRGAWIVVTPSQAAEAGAEGLEHADVAGASMPSPQAFDRASVERLILEDPPQRTRRLGALGLTQSEGRFRILGADRGPAIVEMYHPDVPVTRRLVEIETDTRLDIEIPFDLTLRGLVTDTEGTPIPDLQLSVRAALPRILRSVTTQADGRFVLTGLPPGRYEIQPLIDGRGFHSVGESTAANLDALSHDRQDLIHLQLRRGRTLEGRAVGWGHDESLPPEFFAVHVDSPWQRRTAEAGPGGRFVLDGLVPGTWEVSASHRSGSRTQRRTVEVESGRDPLPITFVFPERFEVRGQARLPVTWSHQELSVHLTRSGEKRPTSTARAELDGSVFLGAVDAGPYDLAVSGPSGTLWRQSLEVSSDLEVEIPLDVASLRGTVRGPDGQPLGDALVLLGEGNEVPRLRASQPSFPSRSKHNGRFDLGLVAAGPKTLLVMKERVGVQTVEVDPRTGDDLDLDIVLEPAAELHVAARLGGRTVHTLRWLLTDEAGKVVGMGWATPAADLDGDTDPGSARIGPVPAGRWRLLLSAENASTSTLRVDVRNLESTGDEPEMPEPVIANLHPDAKVQFVSKSGEVYACSVGLEQDGRRHIFLPMRGGPIAEHVAVRTLGQRRRFGPGSGLDGFPAGRWNIEARCETGFRDRLQVELTAGQESVVLLP